VSITGAGTGSLPIATTGSGAITIDSGATGAINNMNIGATTRGTGAFTTLGANGAVTLNPTTTAVTITSGATGAMDNVNIGGTTAGTGRFTTLTATGTTTLATALTGVLKATSGVVAVATSGTDYSPAISITDDTTTNSSHYIVLEDVTSGNISTVKISSTKLYFNPSTGTLNATVFNSLSDENQKINIEDIPNALDVVQQLKGVSFNWKSNNLPSYGVIAQDLEKVIPEIVSTDKDGAKSVNYNGIIAFLINAVQEQQKQIDELKDKINGNAK
jgi:energy-coupling factor transporter ATP-binding protein EcfA2